MDYLFNNLLNSATEKHVEDGSRFQEIENYKLEIWTYSVIFYIHAARDSVLWLTIIQIGEETRFECAGLQGPIDLEGWIRTDVSFGLGLMRGKDVVSDSNARKFMAVFIRRLS